MLRSQGALVMIGVMLAAKTAPSAAAEGLESAHGEGPEASLWYLSPQLRHTWLYGSDTLLAGARGAWSMDRNWAIGGELSAAINALFYANSDARSQDQLLYYGAFLERSFAPESTFHGAASVLVGGGMTQYEAFLSLEPRADLRVNLSRFVRVGWGLGYRLTRTLQANAFSTDQVGGISTQVFVQLGNL